VIDELNEEDELTRTVLSDFQKVSDRIEPGPFRELERNLISPEATQADDLDLSWGQRIPASHLDVGSLPDADAARNFAVLDPGSECLGELQDLLPDGWPPSCGRA